MVISKARISLYLGAFVLLLAAGACRSNYVFRGTAIDPPEAAPGFTLADDRGQSFSLGSLQGKVVLLYFGYTHCPDICPLTLGNLARARRALGPDGSQVQVVFVTTDPDRDSARVLQDYLGKFDTSFVGIRGEWGQVSSLLETYYASASKHDGASSPANYSMDHTSYIYAIDRNQKWRAIYSQDSKVEDITSDMRYLLDEK